MMDRGTNQLQLPLETLLWTNKLFTGLFFIYSLSIFTYKSLRMPYYSGWSWMWWDFTSIFIYVIVDFFRIKLCSRGNRNGKPSLLLLSLVGTGVIMFLHIYYLALQYYILRVEMVANILGLVITGLEANFIGFSAFLIKMS